MASERILSDLIATAPPPFDTEAVSRARETLAARGAGELLSNEAAAGLLDGVFGASPFLTRLITRDPARAARLLATPPDKSFESILARMARLAADDESAGRARFMAALREAKQEASLLIALCDLGGAWDLDATITALSRFADGAVDATLARLLADAEARGELASSAPDDCGIAIVAMGKYGAYELNYSSDIDLIVFYDPECMPVGPKTDERSLAIRITKDLVRIMQDQTEDGYVFRTDLRLRPNAGSSAAAISVDSAERYYEAHGQNWERAAMIKARVCAGDAAVGDNLMQRLRPYVWRKYLDHAAIQDIHSIKRQIHAARGFDEIRAKGHNIKLGRGGIREIEFFAQTQQLILGGRIPALREHKTKTALSLLADNQLIAHKVARELSQSYDFLRELEHRLQMVNDEQTHLVPEALPAFERIACFMGFVSPKAFRAALLSHLRRTHDHYKNLFASEDALSGARGSLVFTGVDDDPDTIQTLKESGFQRPHDVAAVIRGWHGGRIRATRSQRAREMLTKLMPGLIDALGATNDPDTAFARFHSFLSGLPSSVQVFWLFYSYPRLLHLVASIVGFGPRLGPYLARHPNLIEALLEPEFFDPLPEGDAFDVALAAVLSEHETFEDVLEAARWWGQAQSFRIGVHVLRGLATSREAGSAFSRLAEAVIRALLPVAQMELEERHGRIDGAIVVVALGKLGGGEMTATSDLDIMCVYDAPDDAVSQGDRPLEALQYYLRLTRRLITALSASTAEGALYEIDLQLRPSGRAGPTAVKLPALDRYYHEDAWTWELMALTRARVVAGSAKLAAKTEAIIAEVLRRRRSVPALACDVDDMRLKLRASKGSRDHWNIKHAEGGIVDLEFTCQFLQLAHAPAAPSILSVSTRGAFEKIRDAGLLDRARADELIAAADLFHALSQATSIAESGRFGTEKLSPALCELLARIAGAPNFDELERKLTATLARVDQLYGDIVVEAAGEPS